MTELKKLIPTRIICMFEKWNFYSTLFSPIFHHITRSTMGSPFHPTSTFSEKFSKAVLFEKKELFLSWKLLRTWIRFKVWNFWTYPVWKFWIKSFFFYFVYFTFYFFLGYKIYALFLLRSLREKFTRIQFWDSLYFWNFIRTACRLTI